MCVYITFFGGAPKKGSTFRLPTLGFRGCGRTMLIVSSSAEGGVCPQGACPQEAQCKSLAAYLRASWMGEDYAPNVLHNSLMERKGRSQRRVER